MTKLSPRPIKPQSLGRGRKHQQMFEAALVNPRAAQVENHCVRLTGLQHSMLQISWGIQRCLLTAPVSRSWAQRF